MSIYYIKILKKYVGMLINIKMFHVKQLICRFSRINKSKIYKNYFREDNTNNTRKIKKRSMNRSFLPRELTNWS